MKLLSPTMVMAPIKKIHVNFFSKCDNVIENILNTHLMMISFFFFFLFEILHKCENEIFYQFFF
jgi:ACR3 family arsenite efflux pump ArsB